MQGAVISINFFKIYVLLLIIFLRIFSFFCCKIVSPEKKWCLAKKKNQNERYYTKNEVSRSGLFQLMENFIF